MLERSIATLLEHFPATRVVYPGHMGVTTLGAGAHRATHSSRSSTLPTAGAPPAS